MTFSRNIVWLFVKKTSYLNDTILFQSEMFNVLRSQKNFLRMHYISQKNSLECIILLKLHTRKHFNSIVMILVFTQCLPLSTQIFKHYKQRYVQPIRFQKVNSSILNLWYTAKRLWCTRDFGSCHLWCTSIVITTYKYPKTDLNIAGTLSINVLFVMFAIKYWQQHSI
jgi:hypothetical protein